MVPFEKKRADSDQVNHGLISNFSNYRFRYFKIKNIMNHQKDGFQFLKIELEASRKIGYLVNSLSK